MKLRVEFIAAEGSQVKHPYLVDVERDEILPCQTMTQIESDQHGYPTLTVRFDIDGNSLAFDDGDRDV